MDEPTTPSAALSYWISKRGITAYQLAKDTLLKASRISEILAGKRRITTETATVLGSYFGNGPEYWLSLQTQFDINKSTRSDGLRSESRGDLSIGGWRLRCYVTGDERRLVDERDIHVMLGINSVQVGRSRLAALLDSPYLKSAKMDGLRKSIQSPFKVVEEAGTVAYCYEGEVIIDFCRALMDVRRVKGLPEWAMVYAETAEIIVASVAKVGIAALIDEATGHQTRRHKEALQRLLDGYFRQEYAAWSKRFPDWFYEEIFRLKHWKWNALSSKRPPCVGKVTKDIVYSRIEAGVVEELERRNPLRDNGSRPQKHHQHLTDEIGIPALDTHFYALRGLMRIFHDWDKFYHTLQLAYPKKNEIVQLELDDFNPECGEENDS